MVIPPFRVGRVLTSGPSPDPAGTRERASYDCSAVDAEHLAGDVAGLVGAQEGARGGDVVTRPEVADRDGLGHDVVAGKVTGQLGVAGHRRVDARRRDVV